MPRRIHYIGGVCAGFGVGPGVPMPSSSVNRAKVILAAEAAAISAVELSASFDSAINTLYECQGKIITTGMGKAGFVAHKFAATLCSTGTPAVYVHPGEASHGDLGVISHGDCIVAFSNSGRTREVLEFVELARRLECGPIIGITCAIRPTACEDACH